MREADKSYLWCTEAWFRTKPGTTPRTRSTTLNLTATSGFDNKAHWKQIWVCREWYPVIALTLVPIAPSRARRVVDNSCRSFNSCHDSG